MRFQSLTGRPYRLYLLADPSLSNDGMDDSGSCSDGSLLAGDSQTGSAVITQPALTEVSCGYMGTSDGWLDLSTNHRLTSDYSSAPDGNVVQTGRTSLTGTRGDDRLTVALAFGGTSAAALSTARASIEAGFPAVDEQYAAGWHRYLASLRRPPDSLTTAAEQRAYLGSAMVLAASEDKTYRGAYVASPTMPWAWGTGLQTPRGRITSCGRGTCTRSLLRRLRMATEPVPSEHPQHDQGRRYAALVHDAVRPLLAPLHR